MRKTRLIYKLYSYHSSCTHRIAVLGPCSMDRTHRPNNTAVTITTLHVSHTSYSHTNIIVIQTVPYSHTNIIQSYHTNSTIQPQNGIIQSYKEYHTATKTASYSHTKSIIQPHKHHTVIHMVPYSHKNDTIQSYKHHTVHANGTIQPHKRHNTVIQTVPYSHINIPSYKQYYTATQIYSHTNTTIQPLKHSHTNSTIQPQKQHHTVIQTVPYSHKNSIIQSYKRYHTATKTASYSHTNGTI